MDKSILEYLHSGFVWDKYYAQNFLDSSLLSVSGENFEQAAKLETTSVLEQCVAQAIEEGGKSNVLLPLTGGLDSRSILAGYLANYGKSSLICCTVDQYNDEDVIIASEICRTLGLEWIRLDPADFNMNELNKVAKRVFSRTGSYGFANSLVMRMPINELAKQSDATVLTGWGGTIVGSKLTRSLTEMSDKEQIESFLGGSKKSNIQVAVDKNYLKSISSETVQWARKRLPATCHITDFELLKFAYPMKLRIEGSVNAIFDCSPSVFVRPIWLSHWYGKRPEARVDRNQFAMALQRNYPDIFDSGLVKNSKGKGTWISAFASKVSRKLKFVGSDPVNESLDQTFCEAKQVIMSELGVSDNIEGVNFNFNSNAQSISRKTKLWIVSLAMHLKAGTLKK